MPVRLLKQRTDPLMGLEELWKAGAGAGRRDDGGTQGKAVDAWPQKPILQVCLGLLGMKLYEAACVGGGWRNLRRRIYDFPREPDRLRFDQAHHL